MMQGHKLTNLKSDSFSYLITITDYTRKITKVLSKIIIPNLNNMKVLVDTAIAGGLDDYRFLSAKVINCRIDINSLKYISVSKELELISNAVLDDLPFDLYKGSVMTSSQICRLKETIRR